MVVLASDHLIKDEESFRSALKTAIEVAEGSEAIVTLGIKPDKPETGYGYLETEDSRIGIPAKVLHFCEKPALERAKEYLISGHFFWNSGMFIFRVHTMFKAFKKLMPNHWAILKEIKSLKSDDEYLSNLKELFKRFVKISIDFGIMEKYANTYDDSAVWVPAVAH
ncbi:MAG: sugar phosphate nucleotidyltransferase [Bacteroidales bacterium]|nr:sugar phosphate nucleotidyltransferase [Bacteroidales bacterium]